MVAVHMLLSPRREARGGSTWTAVPGKRVFRKALSRAARVLAPSVLSIDIAFRSHERADLKRRSIDS